MQLRKSPTSLSTLILKILAAKIIILVLMDIALPDYANRVVLFYSDMSGIEFQTIRGWLDVITNPIREALDEAKAGFGNSF